MHHCKDKHTRTVKATRRGGDREVSGERQGKNKERKGNGKERSRNKSKYRKAAKKGPRKSSTHDSAFISIIVLL